MNRPAIQKKRQSPALDLFLLFALPLSLLAASQADTTKAALYQRPDLVKKLEVLSKRYRTREPWVALGPEVKMPHHRGLVAALTRIMLPSDTSSHQDKFYHNPIPVPEIERAISAIEQGEDYIGLSRGSFYSAYYSRADGSGQPYVIELPHQFEKRERWPVQLIIRGHLNAPNLSEKKPSRLHTGALFSPGSGRLSGTCRT